MELLAIVGALIALLLLIKFGGTILKALLILAGTAIVVSAFAYFYYIFFASP